MTGKKTVIKLIFGIIGLVTLLSPVVILNYKIDAFHALKGIPSGFIIEPNFHAVKVMQVLKNKDKFDSFLFGSSRGMQALPSWIGEKGYNNAYPGGTPNEFLDDLKIYISHNVKISNIYILLDDLSYTTRASVFDGDLNKKPYPVNL